MKQRGLDVACVILVLAIMGILLWGIIKVKQEDSGAYEDGIVQVDLNTIYLPSSDIKVNFSEVILGQQQETRKLIVSTHEATVSTQLSDSLINNVDFLTKTQKVSYFGTGYFVVDLDNLTAANIMDDPENKTLTIKIGHAYLEVVDIDPEKVIVDEVKQGLLAWGKIKLTMNDYNAIERELVNRMEEKFNTAENGQKADVVALQMVKEVYEPIVKAIDPEYNVVVEFR